jgi:hypothetical protein
MITPLKAGTLYRGHTQKSTPLLVGDCAHILLKHILLKGLTRAASAAIVAPTGKDMAISCRKELNPHGGLNNDNEIRKRNQWRKDYVERADFSAGSENAE